MSKPLDVATRAPHEIRAPEIRTYPTTELRVVDLETDTKLTTLHGRAVPYNVATNVGFYLETVAPGAFSKSIREAARGLPLLLWHDNESWPIGRAVEWDEVEGGLDGTWALDDADLAQRAARQARDGFLTGLSVGFQPLPGGSSWEFVDDEAWVAGELDSVTRTEARLLEVSLTPTPAFAGAGVTLVRSLGMPPEVRAHRRTAPSTEVDHWRRVLDTLRV